MSYQAVDSVKQFSKAKDRGYTLMLIIATHADKETFSCFPSRKLLLKETRFDCERTLQRHLKALELSGELTLSRGNGRGNLTIYTINLPKVDSEKGDTQMSPFNQPERVTNGAEKGDKFTAKDDIKVSPFPVENSEGAAPERVTNSSERVTNRVGKGDKSLGAYKDIEPCRSHKEPCSSAAPVENSPLVPGPLAPPNPNKRVTHSRHEYGTIHEYVLATKPHAFSSAGLASKFQRTGEEDAQITAWLAKRERQAAAQQQAEQAAAVEQGEAYRWLELQEQAERYVASLPPDEYAARAAPIADALKRELGPEKLIRWTDEAFADHVRAKLIRQYLEQHQTTKGEHHEISSTHSGANAYATA